MSKDYASQANNKKSSKGASRGSAGKKRKPVPANSAPSSVQWLLAAVVVVLFIGGLSFLKKHQEMQRQNALQDQPKKAMVVRRIPKEPEFDFYTILPKEKVWAPKNSAKTIDTPTEANAPVAYIVQVAAFQQETAADQFKAKLLAEGYAAQADTEASNGWFRVWIGPLKNLADAQDMQMKTAQTNNVKGIILQVPVV